MIVAPPTIRKTSISHVIALKGSPLYKMTILTGVRKRFIYQWMNLHLFIQSIRAYRSLPTAIRVLKKLKEFMVSTLGAGQLKLITVNRKYYHHLYAPGFPSKIFDAYILGEFNRIRPIPSPTNMLTFLFFAITRKCPLQCEHCFEWDNLNKKETLDLKDLRAVINRFQRNGISQFHLSGGEPMVRIKELNALIASAEKKSEFYVLTSGFNFTEKNAKALKDAGLTGVVISLDHFEPEKHNSFRGFSDSFSQVIRAIQIAQEQQLIVALTICVTKSFISWHNLMAYMELAKKMKVVYVQLLEPKAVGHYQDRDVFLAGSELAMLEKFFLTLNFDPHYQDFPIVIYHGYHQRRIGCLNGGNRTLYIDSAGFINACPFCHTRNFNVKDLLADDNDLETSVRSAHCPAK
jgi:MoaA/NifB/PqqE/SkfB family radical SAM enzyme